MQVNITIKNIDQIRRAFGKAPTVMANNLNAAIHKSVLSISRQSRINTPVDTGRLRASTREVFSYLKGEVGTHTNYDMFVHQGTRYMRARPYLASAVQSEQGQVDNWMREAVQKTLDHIGKET